MERKNNYEIQAAQARALFCARDLDAVAREHGLRQEGQWLHLRLLGEPYRVSRRNGHIERGENDRWLPADGFDETLTIFDLLCDAKPGRHAAGTWRTTLDFGGQVHRGLLENEKPDALELLYDKDPARLRAVCETLGGEALPGADVSYALPFFEDLRIAVQFWHGDEEFSPRLRFLWDAAADQYLRYETGELDPGVFRMTRLAAIGFDILFVITAERHTPINEENELLDRFRELSNHGKASLFMTLDALERLAPNLRRTVRKALRSKK